MPLSRARRLELIHLAELHAADSEQQVERVICALVSTSIGADLVHVLELAGNAAGGRASTSHPELFPAEARAFFEANSAGHPLVDRVRRLQGPRALRLSELVSWQRWRGTGYYHHCHRPIGIRDSLSFALPIHDGTLRWPVLLRTGRPFNDADRDHLDLLRHHIVPVWRRVLEGDAVASRTPLDVERLLQRHATAWRQHGLTRRECEVLAWLVQGLGYRELGAKLAITAKTVEHHVARIVGKLGVRTRGEAVRRALVIV